MIEEQIRKGYKEWISTPERKRSPEVDFGCWWTLNIGKDDIRRPPFWRVSWIKDTGELYAVNLSQDTFFVIATISGREHVEDLMDGWAESNKQFHMDLRMWAGVIQNF